MKTSGRRKPARNPWLAWHELAWKTGVMMLESAEVIGHRTRRIAAAGARPSARDQRELARMTQEKFEAALESVQAMAVQAAAMNLALWRAPFAMTRPKASQLSRSMARIAHGGLAPIHRRAAANARRLRRG